MGPLADCQVAPEFVEVKTEPELAAATSLVPSADEATHTTELTGMLFETQVVPESAVA
jgi:NCAIR mutase (PurE)-related protein